MKIGFKDAVSTGLGVAAKSLGGPLVEWVMEMHKKEKELEMKSGINTNSKFCTSFAHSLTVITKKIDQLDNAVNKLQTLNKEHQVLMMPQVLLGLEEFESFRMNPKRFGGCIQEITDKEPAPRDCFTFLMYGPLGNPQLYHVPVNVFGLLLRSAQKDYEPFPTHEKERQWVMNGKELIEEEWDTPGIPAIPVDDILEEEEPQKKASKSIVVVPESKKLDPIQYTFITRRFSQVAIESRNYLIFEKFLQDLPPKSLVCVNFELVKYLSSTGCGVLCNMIQHMEKQNTHYIILNASKQVMVRIDLLGLQGFLGCYQKVKSARKHFAKQFPKHQFYVRYTYPKGSNPSIYDICNTITGVCKGVPTLPIIDISQAKSVLVNQELMRIIRLCEERNPENTSEKRPILIGKEKQDFSRINHLGLNSLIKCFNSTHEALAYQKSLHLIHDEVLQQEIDKEVRGS